MTQEKTQQAGALQGMRVLDFSRMLPGPWSTQMLADLGADVIKVEQPGVGDLGRHNSPNFKSNSVYFNTVNLNKRSVTLDLAKAEDVEFALSLMASADVVVESFRSGVAARLGIAYEAAKKVNPSIVYCSITGFGQHGPFSDIPGHDLVIQSTSGVMGVAAKRGEVPPIPGFQTGDYVAASYAVIAVLAALNRRAATGEGGHIDVSMFDSLFSMSNIFNGLALARASGNQTTPAMELWGGNPRYTTYLTQDGKAVAVSLLEARIWAHFCRLIGREDLVDKDEGPEHRHTSHGGRSALYRKALEEFCAAKPRDELVAWMVANDVPILPVYSPQEALGSEHARARGLVEWIDHPVEGRIPVLANPLSASGLTTGSRRPAPALGEHTDAVRANGW
jgi:CoA:oxalate CoA-transferase